MLRKDRERDAAFAWEVFQKAPYATLSLTEEGTIAHPSLPSRGG